MLFPTFRFALFFAAVLPASWLLMPHARRWRLFMLAASFVFYGAWDWRYTFLLAASIVANQFVRRAHRPRRLGAARQPMDRRRRRRQPRRPRLVQVRRVPRASPPAALLDGFGLGWEPPIPQVVLPIGISFFTFQALSYVIDVAPGEAAPGPVPRLRRLPLLLPPPRRRPDRAGGGVPAPAAAAAATRGSVARRASPSGSSPSAW